MKRCPAKLFYIFLYTILYPEECTYKYICTYIDGCMWLARKMKNSVEWVNPMMWKIQKTSIRIFVRAEAYVYAVIYAELGTHMHILVYLSVCCNRFEVAALEKDANRYIAILKCLNAMMAWWPHQPISLQYWYMWVWVCACSELRCKSSANQSAKTR